MGEMNFLEKLLDGVGVEWRALKNITLPTANCRIPDDCIDKNRYPLFMARSVLRELIESLPSTRSL